MEVCRFTFVVWRLSRAWLIVAFSKATCSFWLSSERQSTNYTSCHKSLLENVDRAISITSFSLRESLFGLAWPVERPDFWKQPVFWRLERVYGRLNSILADDPYVSCITPKVIQSSQQSYMQGRLSHCYMPLLWRSRARSLEIGFSAQQTHVIWLQPMRVLVEIQIAF